MRPPLTQDDIYAILSSDEQFMDVLRSIAAVFDGSWCVFGGQVRNRIWDVASNAPQPHTSTDIDVGIFMPHDETVETTVLAALFSSSPHFEWDVENFGISHLENGDEPWPKIFFSCTVEVFDGMCRITIHTMSRQPVNIEMFDGVFDELYRANG